MKSIQSEVYYLKYCIKKLNVTINILPTLNTDFYLILKSRRILMKPRYRNYTCTILIFFILIQENQVNQLCQGSKVTIQKKHTHKKRVIKFEFCIKDIPQPDAKDISGPYVLSFI